MGILDNNGKMGLSQVSMVLKLIKHRGNGCQVEHETNFEKD